ncbi:hypothetical protein A2U01_0108030, partial [Trifolium medium]|nr:hypothetical protein [Trifolium medium]
GRDLRFDLAYTSTAEGLCSGLEVAAQQVTD